MIFVVRSPRAQNEMAAALERTLSGLEPNAQITVQSWLEVLGGRMRYSRPGQRAVATRRDGPAGGDAGSDGHLRHGGLQRESADEGARHSRGPRRAHEARDERRGWAANRAAWTRIVSGTAVRRVRQPVTRAHCVSGESAGSRGRGRRGANDGAAWRCSVRHSSAASACRRSIQTLAGRVKQVNALHVNGPPGNMQVITRAFCCWRA